MEVSHLIIQLDSSKLLLMVSHCFMLLMHSLPPLHELLHLIKIGNIKLIIIYQKMLPLLLNILRTKVFTSLRTIIFTKLILISSLFLGIHIFVLGAHIVKWLIIQITCCSMFQLLRLL
jgi:hypothetical protein